MQKQFYDITPDMLHFYKKKVNGEDLKQFLIEVGSTVSNSRLDNMHRFIMKLNSLNTDEEQRLLINKYDNFILREMKLKRNVNVASAELALNEIPLNASLDEFLQSMHVESIDDFNKLEIFYYTPTTGLKMIYRKLHVTGQRIDGLSLIYARKIITDDNSRYDTYDIEYNWIEIDVKNEKITFYLPSENVNKIKGEFASRPRIIIENLRKMLDSVYNIRLSNERTDRQLYNMYHKLTSSNEARYSKQIHDKLSKDDFLTKFCAQSLERIDKANYNGTVKVESRIQNIFLRVVITDDFDNYKDYVRETMGSVETFNYKDPDGSSIVGKNGAQRSFGLETRGVMENSTTYFDTKDTIEASHTLFGLTVRWNQSARGGQLVKYVAYPHFMLAHFVNGNVSEEVLEDVFSNTRAFTTGI